MLKKITAVILVLSVLMTTACSSKPFSLYDTPIKFNDPFSTEGEDMSFSDLKITEIDVEGLISSIDRMKELSEKEGSLEELKKLYKETYIGMDKISANYAVSNLLYDIDVQNDDLSKSCLEHESTYNRVYTLYDDAMKTLLNSSYADEMKKFLGEDIAALFDEEKVDIELITELSNEESRLTNEYTQLLATPVKVTIDGEEWDVNKLYEEMNSLTNDEYLSIYLELDKAFNKKALEIYIPLVELRKQIAKEFGFDNPSEYYYERYFNRDYTPEEAKFFHKNVKEHMVPVFNSLPRISHDAEIRSEDVLPKIAEILPLISKEMSDIFNEMTENGLCILEDDMTKSYDGGYTTSVNTYKRPLIYNAIYGNYRSITDTVHEFGHYCDYYLNGIYSPCYNSVCFDIAEVPSMGLEAIFYDYYDKIIEDCNDEKAHLIKYFLSSVIDGCYMDEAQQKIYSYEGELTADIVNDIFEETAKEYGKTDDFERYTWAYISHNFYSPFYYVSYAASSIASLEIWNISQTEGKEKAKEIYLKILSDGSFEYGYTESLKKNGLKGFTDADNLKNIAQSAKNEIDKLMTEK